MGTVEFWFEFASTYSYPAALRIEELAQRAAVQLVYKPFLLGPIFAEQGWSDSPFNLYPAKGRYMWRDLERICAEHDLPYRRPSVFPRNGLLAARVALLALDEPWGRAFVRRVYEANFSEDRDIASSEVIAALLTAFVDDPAQWLARASSDANKARLRAQSEEARTRGIFGAPSFFVDGELFWGHDRMQQALSWPGSER